MNLLVWLPIIVPAVLGSVAAVRPSSSLTRYLSIIAAVLILVCGITLVAKGQVVHSSVLRADAAASYVLLCIGAVAVVALWGGLSTVPLGGRGDALVCGFLTAMSLAVLSDNLGIMWVAIEATTIATAFLVGHAGSRNATEAAWKYVVLGSVGVAIAFLGIVLIYAASLSSGSPTLSWEVLASGRIPLSSHLARAGVALAILGFATKSGLAPMHSWLPDAHSQAPAPVSGLMSGVLLSVAMYSILRIQAVGGVSIGFGLAHGLLLTFGLLSLGVAALLTLTQRDYKRLLAYSSIEHMGIIALGVGTGTKLGLIAALLHMLGHGVVKATMFVLAGRILSITGSSRISHVTGLLKRRPDIGWPFLAGSAGLLGFPPFVTFFTEVAILIALAQEGLWWAAGLAAVLLLVTFIGIARQVLHMTVGARDNSPTPGDHALIEDRPSKFRTGSVVIALLLGVVVSFLSSAFIPVLSMAAAVLGVTR